MKHIRIKFLKQYSNKSANNIVTIEEFDAMQHPLYLKNLDRLIEVLEEDKFIELIYPKYFVEKQGNDFVVYTRVPECSCVAYRCPISRKNIPLANFIHSDCISFFTDGMLQNFIKMSKENRKSKNIVTLEGRELTEKDRLFYIRLDDAACGEVQYFEGIMDKYPNSEYLFFLSAGERNNAAYRLTNDTFIVDDKFSRTAFSGEEIKEALRRNSKYEDTDPYWAVAFEIIDYLKSKRKI